MSCNCGRRTYTSTPMPPKVENCLCINDVRVGCEDGPTPCGGTLQIDLTQYNDVTASSCGVEYSLVRFNTDAFSAVSLSPDGLLDITASDNFVPSTEFEVVYSADSPCSILSDQACVYVCVQDLCRGTNCDNSCDPCTGECVTPDPEIILNDSVIDNTNDSDAEITLT